MKNLTLLFLLLLFSCKEKSNKEIDYTIDYYPHLYNAHYNYLAGNYQEAYNYYTQAFSKCNPVITQTFNEISNFSKTCAILGKNQEAIDFIKKNISYGNNIYGLLNYDEFNAVLKSEEGKNIAKNYEQLKNEALNNLNLELREEIYQMIKVDQSNFDNNKARDSIFKVNDKRLVTIFEKHGYPNSAKIGAFSVDKRHVDPEILLLHTGDSIRVNYFIPRLKEFIKKGDCSPQVLGAVLDNLKLFNGELMEYGTYQPQKKWISDLDKINKNRLEIGLPSLEMKRKIDSLTKLHYK